MSTVTRKYKPYNRLKAYMVENNIRQRELAEILNLSVSNLNQKLNGTGGDFSASEIKAICQHFKISADRYFFYQ